MCVVYGVKTITYCVLVYRTIVQLVERIPDKDEVDGSIPSRSTIYGVVVEVVDALVLETSGLIREGSSPFSPTKFTT